MLTFEVSKDFRDYFCPIKALEKDDAKVSAAESNAKWVKIGLKSSFRLNVNTP